MTSVINRYYDPATGQFVSVDPDLDITNQPYVFTDDDPLNAEDPIGLETLFTGPEGTPFEGTLNGPGIDVEMSSKYSVITTSMKVSQVAGKPISFIEIANPNFSNLEKVNDSFFKKYDLDAHEIKEDILGPKNGSKYDIFRDKSNGDLYIAPKGAGPDSDFQPAGIQAKDGDLSYGFSSEIPLGGDDEFDAGF